LNKQQLKNNRV